MILDALVWFKVFAKRMKGEVLHIWGSSNKHPWNQSLFYFIMQQLIFLHVLVNYSFTTSLLSLSLEIITSNNLSAKIRCGW